MLQKKGVFYDETKNKTSNRVIKVSYSTVLSLQALKTWQESLFDGIGKAWLETCPVFVTKDGTIMHPDTLTAWFGSFIKTSELPQIHIHSLRRTCATLKIANGIAVTTVAGELGYCNAGTTTRFYAHTIQSASLASAELMDNLLKSRKNSEQRTNKEQSKVQHLHTA